MPGARAKITIYDVAREAGVAASTVSRAFGTPERVHPATRDHVLETARRIGYVGRHPVARGFVRRHTQTIALVVPDIANLHYLGLITGASRRASAAGYTLVLADSQESPDTERRLIEQFGRSTDGVILGVSRLADDELAHLARRHPILPVNRQVAGLACVLADQDESTTRVIDHLHALGHRRIAYLAGPRSSWAAARRWEVIARESRRRGMATARMGPFPPFVSGGADAADALLAHGASAAVTHNGLLGVGVLRRLADRGVGVPDEVSVVACDDIPTAEFFRPSLTARIGPMEELGRTAVALLLSVFEHLEPGTPAAELLPPTTTVPADFVARGSTGPAPSRQLPATR